MARIEEYNPQVEAAGPVGAVSPNLDEVNAVGNSIQNAGHAADQISNVIYKRNEQRETTSAYSTFAKARADFYGQINKGIQDGSLDDKQVMQNYQDFVDNQSDGYQTAGGQNYAKRQAARLGSSLQQKASAGMAQISGQATADMADQATADGRSAIQQDPDQFTDVLQSGYEYLDTQSQANGGPINPKLMGKARKQMASEYSFTAIRSLAQMSPDAAQASLDSGYFTRHLDDKQMDEAQRIVSQAQTASRVQANWADKQQANADAAQTDLVQKGFLKQMKDGTFSAKDVLNSNDLDFHQQIQVLGAAEQITKRSEEFRPYVFNNLMKNVVSADTEDGHISSDEQLMQMMASGKINSSEASQASRWLAKDPETKNLNASRKRVLDSARSTLNYAASPIQGIQGMKDPQGGYKNMMFQNAVHEREKQFILENPPGAPGSKPLSYLYDPRSPEFVGKMINDFQMPQQNVLSGQAQSKINTALGVGGQQPTQINNPPGVPTAVPKPTAVPPSNSDIEESNKRRADSENAAKAHDDEQSRMGALLSSPPQPAAAKPGAAPQKISKDPNESWAEFEKRLDSLHRPKSK